MYTEHKKRVSQPMQTYSMIEMSNVTVIILPHRLQCHCSTYSMSYSVGSLSHAYTVIHSFILCTQHAACTLLWKLEDCHFSERTFKVLFLLILRLCCTVNLFQSWNLFKWIYIENIIQAFFSMHLFEWPPALYSLELESFILLGNRTFFFFLYFE